MRCRALGAEECNDGDKFFLVRRGLEAYTAAAKDERRWKTIGRIEKQFLLDKRVRVAED